jgi:hypothetical protein
MDNTTFGNNIPSLPQWTGPPPAMVHIQAILFASLTTSLFSAFLAMLGKQWLNRYDSTDKRGSAIERYQNRQHKLDGIVAWYFDSVMEALPLMLQAALLLLGCALSRYLWEISTTVALVVLSGTSFGVLFYLFITVAGAISDNCPYQTPGSRILRYVGHILYSALKNTFRESKAVRFFIPPTVQPRRRRRRRHRQSIGPIGYFLRALVLRVPLALALDVYHLGRAVTRALSDLPVGTYHLVRRVYSKTIQGLYQQTLCWTCDAFRGRSRHPWTHPSVSSPWSTSRQSQNSQTSTPPSLQTASSSSSVAYMLPVSHLPLTVFSAN